MKWRDTFQRIATFMFADRMDVVKKEE